ncbi:MAG: hypothetical protein R3C53_20125 [Pirellulaceae bacterium]
MTSNDSTPPNDLKLQLAKIDERLGAITKLLERQSDWQRARNAWRWRPSLKTLFVAIAMLACMAAWFGAEMRKSKREHQAIATLMSNGAQVQLGPSESILVALLPGTPADPPAILRRWLGPELFSSVKHIGYTDTTRSGFIQGNVYVPYITPNYRSSSRRTPRNRVATVNRGSFDEVRKALAATPEVKGVRLSGFKLSTDQLAEVFALSNLESLDLSRTQLDQESISAISSTRLRWFDGSHTWLGDQAAFDLSKCSGLSHLNLDRTTLTDDGLEYLKSLEELKYLSIQRVPVTLAAVKKFADAMPNCFIQYQPLCFDDKGVQDPAASMLQAQTFGQPQWNQTAMPPFGSPQGQNFYY